MNEKTRKNISAAGLLIAIGIVYGDIGTSPLYVMKSCLLYTSPSPRDGATSRMPSSA